MELSNLSKLKFNTNLFCALLKATVSNEHNYYDVDSVVIMYEGKSVNSSASYTKGTLSETI